MSTKVFRWCLTLASSAILVSTGCASPGKRTGIGAGVGAVAGSAVGGAAGGWGGAGIGAAAGGVLGGALGNILDKQANELKEVADTQRTKNGILVKLKNDLLFDTGSAVLKDEAVNNLSNLGDVLKKYPEDRIKIEGYTDNTGSVQKNELLSQRRAAAVRGILISRGINENQMLVMGKGETKPIASNHTAQGRAENRRVELHIDIPKELRAKSLNEDPRVYMA